MAARQAEVAALLETVRSDIDSLQHALGTSPGTARNANAKRAPAANGRRRRRATQASEKASAQQALGTSPSTAPNANAKLAPAANGRPPTAEDPGRGEGGDLADGIEQDAGEAYAPGEDSGRAGRDLAADDGVLAEEARRESWQQGLTFGATSNTST